jgi:hypothetical protein
MLKRLKIEAALWLPIFIVFGYFFNGAGWNPNARLDAIFSFAEPGTPDYHTFRINRFIIDEERGINIGLAGLLSLIALLIMVSILCILLYFSRGSTYSTKNKTLKTIHLKKTSFV